MKASNELVFSMLLNSLPSGGTITRAAWGSTIRRIARCQSTAASTSRLVVEREGAQAPLGQDRLHRPVRVQGGDRLAHRSPERIALASRHSDRSRLDSVCRDLELAARLLDVVADRRIVREVGVDLAGEE